MNSPSLWYVFTAAFVVAGLLNLARAARTPTPRRTIRGILGVACFVWAASAALTGAAGPVAGAVAAGAAVLVMLAAAALGVRQTRA